MTNFRKLNIYTFLNSKLLSLRYYNPSIAEDCRGVKADILRSLVQIRFEGFLFSLHKRRKFLSFCFLWIFVRKIDQGNFCFTLVRYGKYFWCFEHFVVQWKMTVWRICFHCFRNPSIAQFVEEDCRGQKQISLGHWFQSGSREFIFRTEYEYLFTISDLLNIEFFLGIIWNFEHFVVQ